MKIAERNDLVKVDKLHNSPLMLVIGTSDEAATCTWFDKNGVRHTEPFPKDILRVDGDTSDKKIINTKALF